VAFAEVVTVKSFPNELLDTVIPTTLDSVVPAKAGT
jgi:hypothetical protein